MWWYNELTEKFLKRGYLEEKETIEDKFNLIHSTITRYKGRDWADKILRHIRDGNMSLSTPILNNYGKKTGLPISCFNTYVGDSIESILKATSEIGMMCKQGGGTSGVFTDIRSRGSKISAGGAAHGPVSFLPVFKATKNVISQGTSRRGEFAPYLSAGHPNIMEWLTIRNETSELQDLPYGIVLPEDWYDTIENDEHRQEVMAKIIECRFNTGFPYIVDLKNCNGDNLPEWYKGKRKVHSSNMCSEVMPLSTEEESYTCCLASANAYRYDEWKNTDLIECITVFLDSVYDDFLEKAEHIPFMERAYKYAKNHRPIGIGLFGWHSYLQKNMIAFESMQAKMLNVEIIKLMKERSYQASKEQALIYGEPEFLKGSGMRNGYTLAIAPTKSTAFIFGQMSEMTEPRHSNIEVKDLAKSLVTLKNKELESLLESKGFNTSEIWNSIKLKGGSVQHLDCLNEHEKNVFKTFMEISPKELIIQASQRQKYIDQSQSLNLMIHPDTSAKDYYDLLKFGHDMGIKTFYYHISVNASQELAKKLMDCESCSA